MSSTRSLLAFARALFATNLRSALALRGAFLLQTTFMILNNLTFFVFWWILFARVPNLRGWRIADVELLFGVAASGFGLVVTLAGGVRHLGRFIDEGELDPMIAQPKPTLLYALGCRSQPSGFGDLLSGLAFLVVSGHASWSNAPLVLLAVLSSAAAFLGSGIVFFSLAFWFRKTETFARQLWELLITFSLYPEPLFGGALRLLLFTVLPAGFVGYLPARVIREATLADAALLLAGSAAYLAIAVWLFSRGLRRYSSGSRFGVLG